MSIDEDLSQDPLDAFQRSVVNGTTDWPVYFQQLRSDQKTDADQLLYDLQVTTPRQPGSYSVVVSRSGIHPDFSLPVIDGETADYNEESEAGTLADYLNSVQSGKEKQVLAARVEKTD